MDCDWIFLNADGSKIEVTLAEQAVPRTSDGKWHGGKGYRVRHAVTGRTTTPNPCIIATENIDA